MERSRQVQLPAEPRQACDRCGEVLVVDAGEFLPMGRKDPVHIIDDRSPYCPNGHRSGDEG